MHCQTALLFPQERNLSVKSVINHCWLKKCLLMLLMPDVDYKIQNRTYVCTAKAQSTKTILSDITAYANNLLASQINENSMLHHNSVICEKCHNTYFAGIPTDMHNL